MQNISLLTFCLFTLLNNLFANDIGINFRQPTEATKPWCYWYWLGGDITADGISKDLEKMAEIGIKRAMIGTIAGGTMKTDNAKGARAQVQVLSSDWEALKLHALREAKRVGVELYFSMDPVGVSRVALGFRAINRCGAFGGRNTRLKEVLLMP